MGRQLQQEYRQYSLHAGLHEREIVQALGLLRSAGVEPLLVKGWAAARHYAEPGLRPCGDIDLCVLPGNGAAAREALRYANTLVSSIDLHEDYSWAHVGYSLLSDRSIADWFGHSQQVPLGNVQVRVMSPEDHLRLLCLHLLGHGAWRPLWLCDVAAALEARPAGFDWDRCLGGNQRRTDWVACALGLAHQLLGARIDDTPVAARARALPRWLAPAVLRQWGQHYQHRGELVYYLHRPFAALVEFRRHWRNPIEATIEVHGPFNEWPRLPFQIGALLTRVTQLALQRV